VRGNLSDAPPPDDSVEPADRETDHDAFDTRPVVLLIDRDDAVAALATRAIERTGAQALNTLLAGPIDGWQVLHGLRTRPETRNTPVALVSVVDDPWLADELGATAYLHGPVDLGTLE
jgi:hypothetical protein